MSFKSRELIIDVVPARNSPAIPGLLLCVDATRNEQDDAPCVEASQPPKRRTPAAQAEMDLAVLRRQLSEALSQPTAGRP